MALDFLTRCDTTGNGVPDQGMVNTIDDASPAVQFGKEQRTGEVDEHCGGWRTVS